MSKTLYVISDLHLGGVAPSATSPGFQICSEQGQRLLADFLRWVAGQHTDAHGIHLIVNGDSVDFLAEEQFEAFTADQNAAEEKLSKIIGRTKPIWDEFRRIAKSGAEVTFGLGNHDIELALPRPRRRLRAELGSGLVDLVFDNSAIAIGDVLIEHGNRYDGWNAIQHDSLRRISSAVSRREKPQEMLPAPGSVLVIEVMNELKSKYRFIDLLKPEQETVLPMIAALNPSALRKIRRLAGLLRKARSVRYDAGGRPIDPELIAAQAEVQASPSAALTAAEKIARKLGYDPEQITMPGLIKGIFERWRADTDEAKRAAILNIIYEAMQTWRGAHFEAFNTGKEADNYLKAAQASGRNGFRTVIYGHTHLAKRITIPDANVLYLNAGTWVDLMAVPRDILLGKEVDAKRQLGVFVEDLSANKLECWKQILPTFVRVKMEGDTAVDRDLFLYRGGGEFERVQDGPLEPLARDVEPARPTNS